MLEAESFLLETIKQKIHCLARSHILAVIMHAWWCIVLKCFLHKLSLSTYSWVESSAKSEVYTDTFRYEEHYFTSKGGLILSFWFTISGNCNPFVNIIVTGHLLLLCSSKHFKLNFTTLIPKISSVYQTCPGKIFGKRSASLLWYRAKSRLFVYKYILLCKMPSDTTSEYAFLCLLCKSSFLPKHHNSLNFLFVKYQ